MHFEFVAEIRLGMLFLMTVCKMDMESLMVRSAEGRNSDEMKIVRFRYCYPIVIPEILFQHHLIAE
jgi:hypothetical protein